jgi:hypothetical protein
MRCVRRSGRRDPGRRCDDPVQLPGGTTTSSTSSARMSWPPPRLDLRDRRRVSRSLDARVARGRDPATRVGRDLDAYPRLGHPAGLLPRRLPHPRAKRGALGRAGCPRSISGPDGRDRRSRQSEASLRIALRKRSTLSRINLIRSACFNGGNGQFHWLQPRARRRTVRNATVSGASERHGPAVETARGTSREARAGRRRSASVARRPGASRTYS